MPLLLAACAAPQRPPGTGDPGALPTTTARLPPAPTRAELLGQPPAAVQAALGAPTLTRSEPPAEMWQYGNPDCVLDVIYYPDARAGGPAAAYLESRTLEGTTLEVDACLRALAAARR